jgi:hypothetical protein
LAQARRAQSAPYLDSIVRWRLCDLAREVRASGYSKLSARSEQYHHHAIATQIMRTQPRRKHLVIYARKLAIKPRLQIIRGYRRPLLLYLENTAQPPMDKHINWLTARATWSARSVRLPLIGSYIILGSGIYSDAIKIVGDVSSASLAA